MKGDKAVLNTLKNQLDGINAYPFGELLKIMVYNDADENRVQSLLEEYRNYQINYDIQRREKKVETLLGKIYMRFYSEKLQGQPLFLYYGFR